MNGMFDDAIDAFNRGEDKYRVEVLRQAPLLSPVNGRLAQPEHLGYRPSSPIHDLTQETLVPSVFLIAQPTVKRDGKLPDTSPLGNYGDVKVLINSGEYPALHPERCFVLIEKRLEKFNEEEDYIAWAGGDTLAAVFTGVVLERMQVSCVRWLKFQRGWDEQGSRDPEGGYYREVRVPLVNIPERSEDYAPDPRD